MPKTLKEYPVLARIQAGTKTHHDYAEVSFPEQADVILYRTKPRGRWQHTGTFQFKGKRYEVAVARVSITDYNPSDEQVRAVNRSNAS